MSALAARYGAINLSQGFPNYQPDPVLTGMVTEAMAGPFNQYAPMPGHPALRAVLAEKHSAATGRHLDADSEITLTAGATQALFTAIAALVRPGDEVLYFEPAYDSYRPAIIANSATPVAISLSAPDFTIDWEQVATHINGRTRMIIVNTPNNPGCYCWTDEDWTQLESLVEGRDIAVLSDEVYEHILTGAMPHHSILSRSALADKGLAVFSFGKNFHMTGWKIGYIVAAEALTVEFRKLHQYLVFSVHHPTQEALSHYLRQPERYLCLADTYRQKYHRFLEACRNSPFRFLEAQGSYFVLADYSDLSELPDRNFAEWLTREHGVACIPISPFYAQPTGHQRLVRFCFAKTDELLDEAGARLSAI